MSDVRRGGPAIAAALFVLGLAGCAPGGERESGPVAAAAGAAPAGRAASTVDAATLTRGRDAWRSCAKCHCAADPRVPEDADWVRLNETTACIAQGKPAPALRRAIIGYLEDPDTLRPILGGEDAFPEAVGIGKIVVPAEGGSVHLRAERASIRRGTPAMVRLRWGKTAEEKYVDAPAGDWAVINFWHYRRGEDGARWMLSGTDVNGARTLAVDPDAPEFLEIPPVLEPRLNAKAGDGRYTFTLAIHEPGGTRVTVSRNGRLVTPRYRIRAAGGKIVAEGPMTPT